MIIKKKQLLRTALALACTVTIASVNTVVYAAPSSKDLKEKTAGLQDELNSLNSDLSSLSQKLDETSTKIQTMAAETEKAKLDLAAAKLNEDSQYEAMKDRIKFMYEGGSLSLLQVLLTSENMSDFLNKAEYINTISDYDRAMLKEFQTVRKTVENKQIELEEQQKELASMQQQLTSQREYLSSQIASTSGELADYNAQLERAKAAEEAANTAQDNHASGNVNKPESPNKPNKPNNNNNKPNGGSAGNGGGGAVDTGNSTPADTSDVALLAAILQCEAGSSRDGMLAVGTVIMNRVASPRFPGSIHGVVYQKGQFSPVTNGALNKVLSKGPSAGSYSVAKAVLAGQRHSSVINCLFFNASYTGKPGIHVGGNVFW